MLMIMMMSPGLTRTGLCLRACTRREGKKTRTAEKGHDAALWLVDDGSRRGKRRRTIKLVAQRTKIPSRRLYCNTLGRIIHISGARGQSSTHYRAPAMLLAYGRPGNSSLCRIMYTRGQYPHPRPARVCVIRGRHNPPRHRCAHHAFGSSSGTWSARLMVGKLRECIVPVNTTVTVLSRTLLLSELKYVERNTDETKYLTVPRTTSMCNRGEYKIQYNTHFRATHLLQRQYMSNVKVVKRSSTSHVTSSLAHKNAVDFPPDPGTSL